MNLKLLVALSLIVASPAYAQMQKQGAPPPSGPPPTKADAVKIVAAISADKSKVQTYCDLVKLYDQMAQTDEKDTKTAQTIGAKIDALEQKLGPDYVKLNQIDPESPVGKDIATVFDPLDKQCK
jgi:hypothetical protein